MPKNIVIIGAGLAGLISAIRLTRVGFACTIIEKKVFPFHRVCGEYISNEAIPFLARENLLPPLVSSPITNFELSSLSGKSIRLPLDLGGIGVSRYYLDNFLFERARDSGVTILQNEEVQKINFIKGGFEIHTNRRTLPGDFVIGAYGKRSRLDVQAARSFTQKRSPFVGVKFHARTSHPHDLVSLHNFNGGYCGINQVEGNITNICYLVHRDQLRQHTSLERLEAEVLQRNPHLKKIFSEADRIFERSEVINEISFETKEPVWNHVLMVGDAAGMITPLCGNGMAMAIHAAKILSDLLIETKDSPDISREQIETRYAKQWRNAFAGRLAWGRLIQNKLFGSAWSSATAVNLAVYVRPLARFLITRSHGEVF